METIKRKYRSSQSLHLVVLGMWVLFFHQVVECFIIQAILVAYSGFIILFIALLIELKIGALSFLERKYRLWFKSILVFSFFALIYGLAKSHTLQFISRDIWPYVYFACLLLAARTTKWKVIDKMIYSQFFIGLGVFIYIWFTQNIAFERIAILQNTASLTAPSTYKAWGLLFGWQYMLLSLKREDTKSRKIVFILGIVLFTVFGIIMLKRQMIIELAMIIVLKFIYSKRIYVKRTRGYTRIKLATILVAIIVVTFSILRIYEKKFNISYIEGITSRSTQSGSILETTLKDNRLFEAPLAIYNQANIFEVVFGQGLGSVVERAGETVNVVESGFFTVFMKGGILFLIIWYFGLFSILKDALLHMRGEKLLFGLLSTIVIISSPMVPFFINYPSTGYKMFWLGKSVSRLKKEEHDAYIPDFADEEISSAGADDRPTLNAPLADRTGLPLDQTEPEE